MTQKDQEEMSKNTDDLQRAFAQGWEISEDDFEETQDLSETAAQLSGLEAFPEEDGYEEAPGGPEKREPEGALRTRPVPARGDAAPERAAVRSGKPKREAGAPQSGKPKREAGTSRSGKTDRGERAEERKKTAGKEASAHKRGGLSAGSHKKSSLQKRQADFERSSRPAESDFHKYKGNIQARGKKRRRENGSSSFLRELSALDRVIGLTGAAVCLFAVFTFSFVLSARAQEQQVASFAAVGEELSRIRVADENTFLAVADGLLARQQAAESVETEYEEKDVVSEVQVGLNMTSVEKDLKIKFVNRKTGKLIPYIAFEVTITGPDGSRQKTDEDEDGIIYLTDIPGGSYTVEVTGPEGLEGHVLPESAQSVTVKDKIAYEKIDVEDEIKSEAEVNAAAEDTEIKAEVESVLQDTVEWVESTRTPIGDEGGLYIEVKKEDIPDPSQTAKLSFARFAGVREDGSLLKTSGLTEAQPAETEPQAKETEIGPAETETQPKETETRPTETESKSEETESKPAESENKPEESESQTAEAPTQPVETETQPPAETAPQTVKATGVSVNPSSLEGRVGESGSISVTVSPDNASNKNVSFSSDNGSVADVDGNGHVSFRGEGSAVITVKTEDGGHTATVSVKVTGDTTDSLTVNEMRITAGETKAADVKITGSVSSRSFSIADTKYATVDGDGSIKAIRSGTTELTVKVTFLDGQTRTGTAKLTVEAAEVKGISLDQTKVTLKVGETLKLNPHIDTTGYTGCLWSTSDPSVVSLTEHGNGTITAVKAGTATITACSSEDTSRKATCEVTVTGTKAEEDTKTPLKDKDGRQLYIKTEDGKYVEAVVADYYKYDVFYRLNDSVEYKYTGWQTIDGKRYYFDRDGNRVTGTQVIQGVSYEFGEDGALSTGSGVLGIDVSKHNGSIDWEKVKNSGVSFAIIRCGYRGSATGVMVDDPKFKENIQGATAAGLKVGVYYFSQAVNGVEAVEEASAAISRISGYKISYPVFIDVEAAGGRADGLSSAERTEVVQAFCKTVQDSGYTAGVYANKNWLGSEMNTGSFGGYNIWLAQYAAAPTYNGRYELWQYSSTGRIDGISGNVDLNISYLGY
ncbi:MAG TPA: Ig-like domain-containing protein [Candidatus Eisenbergiella merdavium]|uniref:Ig-like domain-containing protein n=1 Tax=Candidatus Eisenbergiella merdavium TaxID=2838551 RepID=A0A9D2NDG8_9FIRM|nr:Ig-like domain-containing protein [Candidatus Eisenbergiella merdavium]